MDNIAVIGGSGFIGSRFITMFQNKFNNVINLNSKTAPLDDLNNLINRTKDIDILIHTAFDHSYKNNIIGIKNILEACKVNGIKKLIYLSSFSVYDVNIKGLLDENSKYSTWNDPYSKEKITIEKILEKEKDNNLDIVILQPTVVFGLGGNWTKYALHVCKAQETKLPNSGYRNCNVVYVNDVANAIYQSCIKNIKFGKFLISGKDKINWNSFYTSHNEKLKKLNIKTSCNIHKIENNRVFHSNVLINFIFILWFKTPFGYILNKFINILKNIRSKKYKSIKDKDSFKKFIYGDINKSIIEPIGITRCVHNCHFIVNTESAHEYLGYDAQFSFEDGMCDVQNYLTKWK